MTAVRLTSHDAHPRQETALVDAGLGEANDAAAPLHEVRPIACFARAPQDDRVLGGAVGRRWGACCELQQLWVDPAHRGKGVGTRLVHAFEAHARSRGCSSFFLETFSFQAPGFYRSLGYRVACELAVYPHGIVRAIMIKSGDVPDGAGSRTIHPEPGP